MRWYLKVFRDYRDFSGRSRRKEFRLFVLINVIVGLLLSLADVLNGQPGTNRFGPGPGVAT